ncbi:glycoside hydrolase family 36 protein [Microbacterium sp. ASV49]|uniref:Alpha-galactosidase n=1 Tax=Microbacterium candidum TaxID=3041922 RepID=A0ABT7MTM5_9MICO|nr:glycoside hydrolase family 36 protein [Microbacterium sp. ASV49]MDL9977804.1 alpha-galactosidase [Microbacterium sp. ASV49]
MIVADETNGFTWGNDSLQLRFRILDDGIVTLETISVRDSTGGVRVTHGARTPLIEVRTVTHGPTNPAGRVVDSAIGRSLVYRGHTTPASDSPCLVLEVGDEERKVGATLTLCMPGEAAAFRASVTVTNEGTDAVSLLGVSSLVVGLAVDSRAVTVMSADSRWGAEYRWRTDRLRPGLLPLLPPGVFEKWRDDKWLNNAFHVSSEGNLSTGHHVPTGVAEVDGGPSIAWDVEAPSSWRYELGDIPGGGVYIGMEGPNDVFGQWSMRLEPGESFRAVSASMAFAAGGWQDAIGQLTTHRRASRTTREVFETAPVVFNDYLKALNGDPSEERLEPYIHRAHELGVDVFCIDAGWYDDDAEGWWDSVGEWQPSQQRFPNGLSATLARIRALGMVPGLWVEPEVIGVRSPLANQLPEEAFFQRNGYRVEELGRYHLDFTHPAAIGHLDRTIDRLVSMGAGYFKFDYNVAAAHGNDSANRSAGQGRLEHARAYLQWIDRIRERHPHVVLENCASGGMRTDPETVKHFQLQQSTDQWENQAVVPISISGLMSVPPEQLAMWCFPDVDDDNGRMRFALACAQLGRFHLSGAIDRLEPGQLQMVAEAIAAYKNVRRGVIDSRPFWPIGLPEFEADWIAGGLIHEDFTRVAVFRRGGDQSRQRLRISHLAGCMPTITSVLENDGNSWSWDPVAGELEVALESAPDALVLDLRSQDRVTG